MTFKEILITLFSLPHPFGFWLGILRFQNFITGPSRVGCVQLLRNLLKNPRRYTYIAINIQISKARYRCQAGFVLSGKEMRTCKDGKWIEEEEPVCMGKTLAKGITKDLINFGRFSSSVMSVWIFSPALGPVSRKRRKLFGHGARFSKLPVIIGPVRQFCFSF